MKYFFIFLCGLFMSVSGLAQTTYLADTGFVTDVGYGGAGASCVFKPGGTTLGSFMDNTTIFRLADSFTVPGGANWTFDTVVIYGYQIGSGTTSPFTGAYLQIYKDDPSTGTAVWGDSASNIMASTGFTGIYRVDTSAWSGGVVSDQRPIMYMKLYLSPAPSLGPGGYWLVWSAKASGTGSISSPIRVSPGRLNPSASDHFGAQRTPGGWIYLRDGPQYIDLSVIIKASASVALIADINNATCLLTIAPVPAQDHIEVSYQLPLDNGCITVYDLVGRPVIQKDKLLKTQGTKTLQLDTQTLPNGTYICELRSGVSSSRVKLEVIH